MGTCIAVSLPDVFLCSVFVRPEIGPVPGDGHGGRDAVRPPRPDRAGRLHQRGGGLPPGHEPLPPAQTPRQPAEGARGHAPPVIARYTLVTRLYI